MRKTGCLVAGGAALLILLIVGISLVGRYNALVTANETIDESWAQVENVLQRRADLIPNLVETVRGIAQQEREVFGEIAEARSRLLAARSPNEAAEANAGLTSALGRLLAIAESYPELRSSENFRALQDQLEGTENRIAVERRRYNEAVRDYNTSVKRFPTNLVAGLLGFDEREYFEAEPGAEEPPQVDFSTS